MIWILYLLALSAFILCLDTVFIAYANSKESKSPQPFKVEDELSLIICAKNEEQNIKNNLEFFLNQKNVHFELILVNDHSTDGSKELLDELSKKHKNLKVLEFTERAKMKGKKAALDYGIRNSSNNKIIVSDIDCIPASSHWLATLASPLERNELILGYSPFMKVKGITNKLSRWENFSSAITSFAFARLKRPYLGLGRNMAYKKEAFLSVGGFSSHKELASGDDDLFVSSLGSLEPAIVLDREAWMYTSSPKNFKSWYKQKRRHLSTSYHYKLFHQCYFGLKGLATLAFYISFLVLLLAYPLNAFLILLFRYLLAVIYFFKSSRQLGVFDILLFFPIWELLLIFAQSIIHIHNFINPRKDKWLS